MKGRLESGEIEKEVSRLVDGESWWVGRKVSKEQGTEVCIQRRQVRMEREGRLESREIEKGVVRLVDGESWWVGRKVSKVVDREEG